MRTWHGEWSRTEVDDAVTELLAGSAGDDAAALHGEARRVANAGDLPGAERLLHQARECATSVEDICRIEGTLAFVEVEQGRADEGLARCVAALDGAESGTLAHALLAGQLGTIRFVRGETDAAIELFSTALEVLTGEERCRMLLNRGTAHLSVAAYEAARRDFEEGTRGSNAVSAAKSAHNLGYLHLLRGELVDALRWMDRARPDLAELGTSVTATLDIDRATALDAAGLRGEAVALLRDVAARLHGSGLWRLQADVDLHLARQLGDDESLGAAERAVRRNREHGNAVDADEARAVVMLSRCRSARPPSPHSVETLADRLERAGRRHTATALRMRAAGLRGAEPRLPDSEEPLTVRLLAGEVAAEVALRAGDTDAALSAAAAAIDELDRWQRGIGSLELQSVSRRLGARVIRLGQRAAHLSGDPQDLLTWSERARELVARVPATRPPEELGNLLADLRQLGPDGDPAARLQLVAQIRHGRWLAAADLPTGALVTVQAVRERAAGERAGRYVTLMEIEGRLIALTLGDREEILDLGEWAHMARLLGGLSADLTMAAQLATPVVRAALQERIEAFDHILEPALCGASSLVVTAPAVMARMPWGQLPSTADVPVTVPTSASAWLRNGDRHDPIGDVGVVVGPGTRTGSAEADVVRQRWHTHTVTAGDRCHDAEALAADVDLLHVSAHGQDREAHPLFASLQLTDGDLFGHDVELFGRVPPVVVLSACGAAGGSLGMARAWLHAGARTVVAAPADIAETAALERFSRLHELLAGGRSPAEAVATAFGGDALDCAVQCYGTG
ncbi:CHAT domain-containing protein [Ruania alba]|uniref:CHAT domain-containing protein n=1 Tax=Ruania alba TaxID=648782 RepID=A0A1H5H9R4_9MICO|nr:CHAT domain-containing protein [Ruania alba]SEE24723.1 CHAT domain-containing protein [Ruania alba]